MQWPLRSVQPGRENSTTHRRINMLPDDILWEDDIPTPIFMLNNIGELTEVSEEFDEFQLLMG